MTTPGTAQSVEWYDLLDDPDMAEDGMQQNRTIFDIATVLWSRYGSRPDVLVSGPTNIIYDRHDRRAVIAPDCYVVFGVDAEMIEESRRSFLVWEWDKVPAFVLEVGSESTAKRDLVEKREIYASLGVSEYWRFDATGGEFYGEPLVGEVLVEGEYRRLELDTDADGGIWSHSEVLGLDFCYRADGRFWIRDSESGEWLNFLDAEREAHASTQIERLREREGRLREREARLRAEARVQSLEAELERLRRQHPE